MIIYLGRRRTSLETKPTPRSTIRAKHRHTKHITHTKCKIGRTRDICAVTNPSPKHSGNVTTQRASKPHVEKAKETAAPTHQSRSIPEASTGRRTAATHSQLGRLATCKRVAALRDAIGATCPSLSLSRFESPRLLLLSIHPFVFRDPESIPDPRSWERGVATPSQPTPQAILDR